MSGVAATERTSEWVDELECPSVCARVPSFHSKGAGSSACRNEDAAAAAAARSAGLSTQGRFALPPTSTAGLNDGAGRLPEGFGEVCNAWDSDVTAGVCTRRCSKPARNLSRADSPSVEPDPPLCVIPRAARPCAAPEPHRKSRGTRALRRDGETSKAAQVREKQPRAPNTSRDDARSAQHCAHMGHRRARALAAAARRDPKIGKI